MAYNKITLHGKQTCDYLYIQTDAPEGDNFSYVNDEPSSWSENTTLYANFSNEDSRLSAGDSAVIGTIDGYEIYRKKYNESVAEYIGTIKKGEENYGDLIIDYAVKNRVEYTYYLLNKPKNTRGFNHEMNWFK